MIFGSLPDGTRVQKCEGCENARIPETPPRPWICFRCHQAIILDTPENPFRAEPEVKALRSET